MSNQTTERLDPLTLPVCGERLIEASAGTGKTFTIGLLYLRLLLGLAFSRPLTVEEILVVTFTEAATAELRGRIRANIHELRIACVRGESRNPLLIALIAEITDLTQATAILLAAERQMDEAGIFTIHGFCQRMLNLNAFESGMLFEQELIENETPLRRRAAADFWRRHCYPLPLPVARVVRQLWSGPEPLLKTLSPWLNGEAPMLKPAPDRSETLEQRHQKIIARIDALKQAWLAAGNLFDLIDASGVDRRSYNSKYLPAWLEKITQWAQSETLDYDIPEDLKRFGQQTLVEKTRKGEPPLHALFEQIDSFLTEPRSLRDLVIARALQEIRQTIQQEKRRHAQLGFDDLLERFDRALQQPGGPALASAIRQRYPVALIDEFQDTDPQQYRIFHTLYVRQPGSALLLIGDPKQAIYAFRGADIFTYIKARSEVSAHYTLETNWRSSPLMVEGVNQLFQRQPDPFLFAEIPFIAVSPAQPNHSLSFTIDGIEQPALTFCLQPGDGVSIGDYQQYMASYCAAEICQWLTAGQQGKALIGKQGHQVPLQASDITILVRSRSEASVMREALNRLAIPSVYLSNRDSVFSTPEARDVLWLLQAVLAPEQERTLRSALASSLFGLDALALDALNQDEHAWDALVDEFDGYRQRWLKRGVLPMLRELMIARQIAENFLASDNGERRLTDLLHLSELLQEAAASLDSEHALVRWLAQQVAQPDGQITSQQMRLESDRHLVQIVTIHKSKGLQYPLVWLPFVANYREAENGVYHDRKTFAALLNLQQDDKESVELAEQERLAEDLRLLYVALTRSVLHCSVGVAPLMKGNRKKEGNSDLHKSALGYLLQHGEVADALTLRNQLEGLRSDSTAVITDAQPADVVWQPTAEEMPGLSSQQMNRSLRDDWRVTSYSGLLQHNQSATLEWLPRLDVDATAEVRSGMLPQLTPHTFPRGAAAGTFLHSLFETLPFTEPLDEVWLAEQLTAQGLDAAWLPVISNWIERILQTPLNGSGVSLNQLPPEVCQVELQFYLPISRLLTDRALDKLVRQDPLSANCPPLAFDQVCGMLKGFIDLVFCWQGKYYLLDYKSNWLGEDSSAYTRQAMEQAMQSHRYDLQYQLYSLALHRYLRHRLASYDYEHHFGGVIYLFLRGLDGEEGSKGIFSTRPQAGFVMALDQLFSAEPGVHT